jgi:hypothetical protein
MNLKEMAMPKKKNRTIADRKERLTSAKKKAKSVSQMIDESMKPSRSFKEAGAIAIGALGPGKIKKAGKVASKAKDLIQAQLRRREVLRKAKVEKAVRRVKNRVAEGKVLTKGGKGAARIKRSETGNRATTGTRKLSSAQEAEKKALGDEFSPAAIAKRSKLAKQARETKAAAKKLTAKRKAAQKRIDKKK